MKRSTFLFLTLLAGPLLAQPGGLAPGLAGRVEGGNYISPTNLFRIPVLVLPELGGTIADTENVVTFQDSFNVHVSIGVFPQDATQRWELSTRGHKDYLSYFFDTFVMPDFEAAFPGGRVESVEFSPGVMGGAFIAYTVLPGGSMFARRRGMFETEAKAAVAKRGNLIFVRNHVIYVITTELAERVTEGTTYTKTTAEENAVLRDRLVDIARKMEFARTPPTP